VHPHQPPALDPPRERVRPEARLLELAARDRPVLRRRDSQRLSVGGDLARDRWFLATGKGRDAVEAWRSRGG